MPADPPDRKQRYVVRVLRLRLEVTYVELLAGDDQEAEFLATYHATKDKTRWRLLPFDDTRNEPFVEVCMSESEMEVAGYDSYAAGKAGLKNGELSEPDRYALLHADIDCGDGKVIVQPWVFEMDGLMKPDVFGDWTQQLERLASLPDDDPDEGGDNVVAFKRRDPSDPPDDPSAA